MFGHDRYFLAGYGQIMSRGEHIFASFAKKIKPPPFKYVSINVLNLLNFYA